MDRTYPDHPDNPEARRRLPHLVLTRVSPYGVADPVWKCDECEASGTLEALERVACLYVWQPCEHCGRGPLCSLECPGIAAALGASGVYLAGFDTGSAH